MSGDEHEPVELELADVDDEELSSAWPYWMIGGDVVGVGRGVDGLDDDGRRRR